MLTPKFRKSPAAERIRRLLHTCVGSLKIPRKGGRHVLSNSLYPLGRKQLPEVQP